MGSEGAAHRHQEHPLSGCARDGCRRFARSARHDAGRRRPSRRHDSRPSARPRRSARSVTASPSTTPAASIACAAPGRAIRRAIEWQDGYEWGVEASDPEAVKRRLGKAFGRSLHIRYLDAGACGACMSEARQLNNPYYNIHRLGFFVTPTPRNADILLVAGPVTDAMILPLRKTYEAMPDAQARGRDGRLRALGWRVRPDLRLAGRRPRHHPGRRHGAGLPATTARHPARAAGRGAAQATGAAGLAGTVITPAQALALFLALCAAGVVAACLLPERQQSTALAWLASAASLATLLASVDVLLFGWLVRADPMAADVARPAHPCAGSAFRRLRPDGRPRVLTGIDFFRILYGQVSRQRQSQILLSVLYYLFFASLVFVMVVVRRLVVHGRLGSDVGAELSSGQLRASADGERASRFPDARHERSGRDRRGPGFRHPGQRRRSAGLPGAALDLRGAGGRPADSRCSSCRSSVLP